jgi:hypothetical protein
MDYDAYLKKLFTDALPKATEYLKNCRKPEVCLNKENLFADVNINSIITIYNSGEEGFHDIINKLNYMGDKYKPILFVICAYNVLYGPEGYRLNGWEREFMENYGVTVGGKSRKPRKSRKTRKTKKSRRRR